MDIHHNHGIDGKMIETTGCKWQAVRPRLGRIGAKKFGREKKNFLFFLSPPSVLLPTSISNFLFTRSCSSSCSRAWF